LKSQLIQKEDEQEDLRFVLVALGKANLRQDWRLSSCKHLAHCWSLLIALQLLQANPH